jgi:hypothetical protein
MDLLSSAPLHPDTAGSVRCRGSCRGVLRSPLRAWSGPRQRRRTRSTDRGSPRQFKITNGGWIGCDTGSELRCSGVPGFLRDLVAESGSCSGDLLGAPAPAAAPAPSARPVAPVSAALAVARARQSVVLTPPALIAPRAFRRQFIGASSAIVRASARAGTTPVAALMSIGQIRPTGWLVCPPAPVVNALRRHPMPAPATVTPSASGPRVRPECPRAMATPPAGFAGCAPSRRDGNRHPVTSADACPPTAEGVAQSAHRPTLSP